MAGWGGLNTIIEDALRRKEEERHAWNPPRLPERQTANRNIVLGDTTAQDVLAGPPKPPTMPAITPVADLKNRTALSHQYTPEAAQELYNTPMWVRYGSGHTDTQPSSLREGHQGKDGVWGFYRSNGAQHEDGSGISSPFEIFINHSPNEEVLAHEFAHKWYDKRLDPYGREAWQQNNNANWHAEHRTGTRLAGDRPIDQYNELYAHNAERGPWYIPSEVRDTYYPGMYQSDIKPPNPPVPSWQYYTMLPDEYPESNVELRQAARKQFGNDTPFSPEYWVNEQNAPFGYFEYGSIVPPSQFDLWRASGRPTIGSFNMYMNYPRG